MYVYRTRSLAQSLFYASSHIRLCLNTKILAQRFSVSFYFSCAVWSLTEPIGKELVDKMIEYKNIEKKNSRYRQIIKLTVLFPEPPKTTQTRSRATQEPFKSAPDHRSSPQDCCSGPPDCCSGPQDCCSCPLDCCSGPQNCCSS